MKLDCIFAEFEAMAQREEQLAARLKPGSEGWRVATHRAAAAREAIVLLRTHEDNQPNEPLTLEELREMYGQPVWIEVIGGLAASGYGIVHLCPPPELAVPRVIRVLGGISNFEQIIPYPKGKAKQKYGRVWVAYRRPPKGV